MAEHELRWAFAAVSALQCVTALALAALVHSTRSPPRARRLLVTLLLASGVSGALAPASRLVPDAASSFAFAVMDDAISYAFVLVYLAFLAEVVPSPLSRALRPLRVPLLLGAAGVAALVLLLGPRTLTGFAMGAAGRNWLHAAPFPVLSPPLFLSVGTFALVCALDAYRRAPAGSLTRAKARSYLAAFALQDAALVLTPLSVLLWRAGVVPIAARDLVFFGLAPALALAFVVALTRALLREHLFDIDLRLKWTVRRGAVVGIFVAAFFVAAAIAEQWLERYGVLAGGAAVGLLLFALRPVERAAERLASAAMPGVNDTEEYRLVRKREVYRAAVESALEDGRITERERSVLATLAQELGLGPKDALDIEREAGTR